MLFLKEKIYLAAPGLNCGIQDLVLCMARSDLGPLH